MNSVYCVTVLALLAICHGAPEPKPTEEVASIRAFNELVVEELQYPFAVSFFHGQDGKF